MRAGAALVAVALGGGDALAAGVSYVRATSQLEAAERRERYHPLNLLDDDVTTIWCEGAPGDGGEQGIEIVFKRRQRIDRVVITPTPRSGRVVTAVRVSDGKHSATVPLEAGPTAEVLSRALEGDVYSITIESVGEPSPEAALPRDVACLADVLLYLRHQAFGGGAAKLRYDPKIDKLVGTWNGGPLGAPEQALIFSLDGTWQWTYTPLLGGKKKRTDGEYRFRGDRLFMRVGEIGRWSDMQYRWQRVKIDAGDVGAPAADYEQLSLGKALGADVAGDYNNARFD